MRNEGGGSHTKDADRREFIALLSVIRVPKEIQSHTSEIGGKLGFCLILNQDSA